MCRTRLTWRQFLLTGRQTPRWKMTSCMSLSVTLYHQMRSTFNWRLPLLREISKGLRCISLTSWPHLIHLFCAQLISRLFLCPHNSTCILPIFLYGSDCWAMSKMDARKIDALDQWCLRMLLGIRWYQFVRNDDVRRLMKQPKLTAIIQSCRLTLFGHIMRMDDNADAKRILLASAPADWRRQLGHPRITWLSIIQQDLKHHHLTLPEAADLAQNRPLWRMMSTYGATQLWVARQKRRRRDNSTPYDTVYLTCSKMLMDSSWVYHMEWTENVKEKKLKINCWAW